MRAARPLAISAPLAAPPVATVRRKPFHRAAVRVLLACAAGLLLAACNRAPPPPSNATPEKAVATSLRLTAAGKFDALLQNRLPPPDYADWRKEWDAARARQEPPSPVHVQQFAAIMQMLTAPDAEAQLAQRLRPQLARWKGGSKNPGTPIFNGILEAAGNEMIAASPQLGPAQKTMARQGLAALVAWVGSADFSDPKKARKAIALVCATARSLHVQTLAQWRALDYATTMTDYGTLWNALEELADLYGLDLRRSFTDATITTTPGATADTGNVTVAMVLAGKHLSATWPMRKVANHWYDQSLLDAWAKAHPAAPVSTAAPATTAGTPNAAPASTPAPARPSGATTTTRAR